jgi:hypothetical protein
MKATIKPETKLPPKRKIAQPAEKEDILGRFAKTVGNAITIPAPVSPLLPPGAGQTSSFGRPAQPQPSQPAQNRPAGAAIPAQAAPAPTMGRAPNVNFPTMPNNSAQAPVPPKQTGQASDPNGGTVINIFHSTGSTGMTV